MKLQNTYLSEPPRIGSQVEWPQFGRKRKKRRAAMGKGGQSWSSYWTQEYQDAYNSFVTKPTSIRRIEQARMVKTLVDSGVWNKLDVFQYYENGNLIDWKDPTNSSKIATLHGSTLPSYVENVGFLGNVAASAYIDTKYNPFTMGINYTINNASYGVYVLGSLNDGRWGVYQGSARTYSNIKGASGNAIANINQSSSGAGVLNNLVTEGVVITNRTASDSYKLIADGIEILSQTNASGSLPNGNMYLLAHNVGGTATNFDSRSVSCFFAGAGLDDDELQYITSAIKTCIFYATKSYGNHIPLMPSPVGWNQHGCEVSGDYLYAMGGATGVNNYQYDIIKNRWTQKSNLPHSGSPGHIQSPVLRSVNGKLYFIGGLYSNDETYFADVYEYNPTDDTYTAKTPMPTAREDFGSAVLNGKIYCFGGLTTTGRTKVLEIFDVANNSWSTGADLPAFKQLGDFGCVCNGKIYAISASDQVYSGPGVMQILPVTTVYEYDPDLNTWTQKSSIPLGTAYNERAVIGSYIYVVGGVPAGLSDELTTYIKDIYRYNTVNDTWTKIVDAPYALHGVGLAEYNNSIYMHGGGRNSTRASDTKEFYKLVL